MNQLTYGNKAYTDSSSAGVFDNTLVSAEVSVASPLSVDTLSADIATIVVNDYDLDVRYVAVDGMLAAADGMFLAAQTNSQGLKVYQYGAPLTLYNAGVLLGVFYLESIRRQAKNSWQLDGTSDIGLLIASNYYGGVYAGISLGDLVSDIINGVISYSLDPGLAATPMYGWIGVATRRDALHACLFAVGAQLSRSDTGLLEILPQSPQTPTQIPDSAIYMGGSSDGLTPATQISVTEHAFSRSSITEPVVLYEGEAAAEPITTPSGAQVNGVLITFDSPAYDLTAQGGVILESGANFAVLGQSPYVVLTGTPYAHTQRVLTQSLSTSGAPNVVTSSDCALVNLLNAENVLTRLSAYYGSSQKSDVDLVMGDYSVGQAVSFSDAFGDPVTGYIETSDITLSATTKARVSVVSGYIPGNSGNFYSQSELITASGVFTVPAAAKGKIRVVLCSGGQGGEDGAPGEPGGRASASSNGSGGAGGPAGSPGSGGRICVYTLSVSPGQVFQVSIGAGGAHGENGAGGALGADTTFGALSTANGASSESGYVDLITGTVYGSPGEDGIPGGAGNGPEGDEGQPVLGPDGSAYEPGAPGENDSSGSATAIGGYGGGAAVGNDGGNGESGEITFNPGGPRYATGGDGGKGADAAAQPDATVPGSGGPGGHGGGGGGGGGTASAASSNLEWFGGGGDPGNGGAAGDGAPGFIIVYY